MGSAIGRTSASVALATLVGATWIAVAAAAEPAAGGGLPEGPADDAGDPPRACTHPAYAQNTHQSPLGINGHVGATDPTQKGRLALHQGPGETFIYPKCGVPKPMPPVIDIDQRFHFEAQTFRNNNAVATCMSISMIAEYRGARPFQLQIYLGAFDPEDVHKNYLSDYGAGSFYVAEPTVMVPAHSKFVVVVSGVHVGHPREHEGSAYRFTVGGCDSPGTVDAGAPEAGPTAVDSGTGTPAGTSGSEPTGDGGSSQPAPASAAPTADPAGPAAVPHAESAGPPAAPPENPSAGAAAAGCNLGGASSSSFGGIGLALATVAVALRRRRGHERFATTKRARRPAT